MASERKPGDPPPDVITDATTGTFATTSEKCLAHRFGRYMALGFDPAQAQALAEAKDVHRDAEGRRWIRPLYWGDVRKLLAAGCSHVDAVRILT